MALITLDHRTEWTTSETQDCQAQQISPCNVDLGSVCTKILKKYLCIIPDLLCQSHDSYDQCPSYWWDNVINHGTRQDKVLNHRTRHMAYLVDAVTLPIRAFTRTIISIHVQILTRTLTNHTLTHLLINYNIIHQYQKWFLRISPTWRHIFTLESTFWLHPMWTKSG